MRSVCWDWLEANSEHEWWAGNLVVDVGSLDVNGNPRGRLQDWGARYVGVDMVEGPNVDVVCRAEDLVAHFGAEHFDAVVSVDAAEHFEDWRACLSQMKRVCKLGGVIFFATVAPGFIYHDYPGDYWRFTGEDVARIFADCEVLAAEPSTPMVVVRKPEDWQECSLEGIVLAQPHRTA